MSSRRRLAPLLLAAALAFGGLAGCGSDDPGEGDLAAEDGTSTSEPTSTTGPTTSTSAPGPSTTVGADGASFDGATTPTSEPAPTDLAVALLTAVDLGSSQGVDQLTFTFDEGIPGYDVAYIEPPVRQDGSGNEVEVEGDAFLQIRFAPASGVDMLETYEPTYTGPPELRGDTEVVTEVVRTGDFEANLTWVVGVDHEVPYRVEADPSEGTVTVELAS